VAALNIKAMEKYDDYDFEGAKQTLEDALALSKRVGCSSNLVTAKTYLYLGVVEVGGLKDYQAGKKAWFKAFALFPEIKVPRRIATPRLMRYFKASRAAFKAAGGVSAVARPGGRPSPGRPGTRARPAPRPKGPPQGLEHTPLSEAEQTKDLEISCRVADAFDAGRVVVFYKPAYAATYRKQAATKKGKWTWTAVVPGKEVRGKQMRYYIVVWNKAGKPVSASGNAASPHLITLKEPQVGGAGTIEENPLTGRQVRVRRTPTRDTGEPEIPGQKRKTRYKERGPKVKKGAKVQPGTDALFSVSVGTGMGFGMLNGVTEVARTQDDFETHEDLPSAVSRGSFYAQLQLGYLLNPNFLIGAMGRIGKTFVSQSVAEQGENNHIDWQVFGRVKYQSDPFKIPKLDWMGWRWYVGGGVGYGYIRHHIKAKGVRLEEGGAVVSVTDTDRARGVMPNAFGGAALLFLNGRLNVFLEANYMAAFASDPEDNLYFHMDFTLGVNTEF
jgi:hypothetical protein